MKELNESELDQVSGGKFIRKWRCTNPACCFHDMSDWWTRTDLKKCPDCGYPIKEVK